MATYDGAPEFEMFNRENYTVDDDRDLPTLTFMSNTHLHELPP